MKYSLLAFIPLFSTQAHALTCQVMAYSDQAPIVTKVITQETQTLLIENKFRYVVSLIDDGRYVVMMIDSNEKAIAAMGPQGKELTLANEAIDRTIACQ